MPASRELLAIPAVLAVMSMTATPAYAAPLPVSASPVSVDSHVTWSDGDLVQNNHRRWRHRRDRGIDGGDVVAGVLILGGIAAIASAVSKKDERSQRYPATYPQPARGDYRNDYRANDGLGNAADMCVEEIERDRRVESVDQVQRLASGWIVSGTLYDGQDFVCTIGQNGRIETIDYAGVGDARPYSDDDYDDDDDYAYDGPRNVEDRQYDDDRYYAERNRLREAPTPNYRADGPQPAYPGGPLPGDDDRPYYEGGED